MTTSNLFGLNFLRPTAEGHSTPVVGDYDPQSQTWGGIVTAQSAGGCASECFNCCTNNTITTVSTISETNYTSYDATDVVTNGPNGHVEYSTDDQEDYEWDGSADAD